MRRSYLVCYDIREPRRLQRVHRVVRGYGERWQYSVFFCVLKDIDRVRLQSDLEVEMNLKEDQAVIIDMGPDEKAARTLATAIGQSLPTRDSSILVI
ncbi:MAG: CRISPR-associated endonuclease Cas2 [Candidatus Coatesbacteria bacterium]|nr:CRISPR-associated endonuclease Cas2 [Candidatus Coatesbacteria bacterium]